MFVSVTRLRLRHWTKLPVFMHHSNLCVRQAKQDEHCKYVATLFDRKLVFWTLTVWDAPQSMYRFLGTGAHLKVMPFLSEWCSEAATAHSVYFDLASIPSIKDCDMLIRRAAKFSAVQNPSKNHKDRHLEPARPYFTHVAKNLLIEGES